MNDVCIASFSVQLYGIFSILKCDFPEPTLTSYEKK